MIEVVGLCKICAKRRDPQTKKLLCQKQNKRVVKCKDFEPSKKEASVK